MYLGILCSYLLTNTSVLCCHLIIIRRRQQQNFGSETEEVETLVVNGESSLLGFVHSFI